MKKRVLLGLAVVLSVGMLAAGCGKSADKTSNATAGATGTSVQKIYDYSEYVSLGDYSKLEVTNQDASVTDEEVDEEIQANLEAKATYKEIKDRAVKDGDVINLDYKGVMDGEAFDGGTAEGASLTIGSNQFIDGFEDGLIGVKPGETVDLDLKFPEPYDNNPDYAGKAVTFTVTVNYIQGDKIIPELNDKQVEKLSSASKTVEEYKKEIREQLEQQKKESITSDQQDEMVDEVVNLCKVNSYPDGEVDAYIKRLKDYYESYASMYGMSYSDFVEQAMQTTEEQLEKDVKEEAEKAVAKKMILYTIASKEGWMLSGDDLSSACDDFVTKLGASSIDDIESVYGEGVVEETVIESKAIEELMKTVKYVDKRSDGTVWNSDSSSESGSSSEE